MSKTFWAHCALFLVNALYGASHLLAKGVMPDYLSPAAFILFRVSCAVVLFWFVYLLSGREKIARKDWVRLALCGLFGVALNQLCFFHGLNWSSSINSGVIMTLNPLLVLVLAALFLREKITLRKTLGIGIAALGAVALTLSGNNWTSNAYYGDLLLLVNATSYAIYLTLSKPLTKKYKPLTLITYVFSFGVLFISIYPPSWIELRAVNFQRLPTEIWWKITYIVLGITFIAYLLTMFALKQLKASATSAYIYFQPLFVLVFSYLFLYLGVVEDYTAQITPFKIVSMLLILMGVWLTTRESSKND